LDGCGSRDNRGILGPHLNLLPNIRLRLCSLLSSGDVLPARIASLVVLQDFSWVNLEVEEFLVKR